jgi:hypothetical protein
MTGKLNAFGIVVSDLARAVRFYRLLGVIFPADAEQSDHGHAEAVLDGGVRLMLDTEETMQSFDPAGAGRPVRRRQAWPSNALDLRSSMSCSRARSRRAESPTRNRGTRSGDSDMRSFATPTETESTSTRTRRGPAETSTLLFIAE